MQRRVRVIESPRSVAAGSDIGEYLTVLVDVGLGKSRCDTSQPTVYVGIVSPCHRHEAERRVDRKALSDKVFTIADMATASMTVRWSSSIRDIEQPAARLSWRLTNAVRPCSSRGNWLRRPRTFGWGPVLHQLADGLGVRVDDIQETVERIPAEISFDTPTGHIAAGTIAGMRSTLTGYVDGKPTLVVDHASRMHDDIAPGWPQPHISIQPRDLGYGGASGQGVYRVEIEGSPAMRCEFEMADDHDHDLGARMAGASRMVNAIPAVCAAKPGLLSALDLPLITGKGLVRPVSGPSPDSRVVGLPSYFDLKKSAR